jgi:Mg2+ and Co2+ transporter CorA
VRAFCVYRITHTNDPTNKLTPINLSLIAYTHISSPHEQTNPNQSFPQNKTKRRYAGSKIRLNGPRFLAYAVVDAIVDEIFPILRQIRKRVSGYIRVCWVG